MPSSEKVLRIVLRLEDQASKELNKAAASIDKLKSNLTSIGTQMTAAFTVPIVAAGAAAVSMAMDLDKSMRNIQSISKITDEEMRALSDTFVDMSTDITKTTDTAQNLALAFYEIQGSGFQGASAMKILEVSTKAASAGLTTTKTAAMALTQVLNAYKLSVNQASFISDIMFETVNRGVGSYEELSAALSNVTGQAAALDIPFHEVSAALATMSRNGISFSEGSVALNMALASLLNPTEELKKAVKELGFTSAEAMLDQLGFNQTIQKLREHAGDSESALNAMFGSVRGGRAILALTGENARGFADDITAMNAAGGAAAEAFAIQTQSFDAAWKNFQNTLNAMLIEVGQILLPVLTGFMQTVLIPLIQGFRSLPEPVKGFVIGLLAILAVIGPIMLIAGQLVSAWATIAAVLPMVATGFAAVMALGAPLLILIGLIVVAIGLLIFNWEQLGTTIMQLGTIIDQATGGFFSKLWTTLTQIGTMVWDVLKGVAVLAYQIGVEIVSGLIKGMASMIIDLVAMATGMSNDVKNAVKQAFGIASPSKVMMEMGKNVSLGFNKGVESLGGLSVNTPQVNGRPVTSNSLAMAGSGGGGGNVTINVYSTKADPKEVAKEVNRELGMAAKRRGARKGK